jgi:glycerophosphoryl diester phosphodiesterase
MSFSSKSALQFFKVSLYGSLVLTIAVSSANANDLVGRAVLPADTFAKGPTSGQFIGNGPINGQPLPFVNKQPVQGFSAVLDNGDGSFMVMVDNGFGTIENSADSNLRVYIIHPDFKTAKGGSGKVYAKGFIELHDPDKKVPFAITNHFSAKRILTGADFDLESIQRAKDGTLWFGEEFGPFLLHTDANGKVLERPVALPDFNPDPKYQGKEVRSPQNPYNEEASAVRIMNAVRAHAQKHGNNKAPVFSPYHVMLKFPGSSQDEHYARGIHTPADLKIAASDVFSIKSLQQAGYPVVTWTVNDTPRMNVLLKQGVNGIISDRPDLLLAAVKGFDANGDGTSGDFIDADGLIDIKKFDAQAHRGGRDLRPENTLPSFEAGLDNLATTLETDTGITSDGVPIHSHDPYIEASKCRKADGSDYSEQDQVLIKDLTVTEIQTTFVCDKVFRGPTQLNGRQLSPVAVAFAQQRSLNDPYVMPTTQQVFDFVKAYVDYYKSGSGSVQPGAELRWKNAEKVRFNIETKINPRSDKDNLGRVYKERTIGYRQFADTLASVIVGNAMVDRADIQSFDFRTLLRVQEKYPNIRTVYLFGDFPVITDPSRLGDTDDSTNLQDENGKNTPWLAGLYWPYRETVLSNPFRAQQSGGFEGMAITPDGKKLLPLLERPLTGDDPQTLLIHEFEIKHRQYKGVQYLYPLAKPGEVNAGSPVGTNIGDFILNDDRHGLVIEREGSQGVTDTAKALKAIFEVTLNAPGAKVDKRLAVNLLDIADPHGLSLPGMQGDVGLGTHFAFPFTTIEDVVTLGPRYIGVLNDNNYPFSIGRHVGSLKPDDEEFIIIKLDEPLQLKPDGKERGEKEDDD